MAKTKSSPATSADKVLVKEFLKYWKKDFESFKSLTTQNKETILLAQQQLKTTTDELANFGKNMEDLGRTMKDLGVQISEDYVSQKVFEEYKIDAEKAFANQTDFDLTRARVDQMWGAAKIVVSAVGLAIVGALLSLIFIQS